MVSHATIRTLLIRMKGELADLETEWEDHVFFVNARFLNLPNDPVIVPSTTIADGLAHLRSEVYQLNTRCQLLAHWVCREERGWSLVYDLPELLSDLAVDTVGGESPMRRLKRTMAMVEIYLSRESALVKEAEEKASEYLEVLHDFLNLYWDEVVDSSVFANCCRTYEDAEQEHIYDADGDKLAAAVADVEERWRDPDEGLYESVNQGFVESRNEAFRNILDSAAKLASFGVRLSRQMLITEIFQPNSAD